MTYSVKSIQYTLQGEGYWSGRGAVFLRFAGCNLWSGREEGRAKGMGSCATWCDTDFVGTDGPGGGRFENCDHLADAVLTRWIKAVGYVPAERFVVLTGGEPFLQADFTLVKALRDRDFYVAVETNGTRPLPTPLYDWVCVSPKAGTRILLHEVDEVKVVFPQELDLKVLRETIAADHWWISPMEPPPNAEVLSHGSDLRVGERERVCRENARLATEFCLNNPEWRLTTQLHKTVGIP